MSGSPPKAPVERTLADVSNVPEAAVSNCSKLAAYSITSSARAISVGGTVRPSTFAALKLTTRSNLTELDRCLHREIGHLLTFKDAINIRGCSTHQIDVVHAVGQ
jgi:hypothetical protein